MRPAVIAIFGPTGVGKTAIALALGRRLRAAGEDPVAVSADALQVYRGLEVLTGAPPAAERAQLEHRMVSFLPVDAVSRGKVIPSARPPSIRRISSLPERILPHWSLPPIWMVQSPPPGARERWEAEVAARGAPGLHAVLVERAPWAAEAIDPHDRQRIVRALELADAGELEPPEGESQLWTAHTRHPTLLVGLTLDRVELYARVDARVDAMLAAGAGEEVLRAHAAGASETARKALGFQELLAGDVDAMKRRTRNFAKRQHTWMRKLADVRVLDVTGRGDEDVAAEIEELANTLRRP